MYSNVPYSSVVELNNGVQEQINLHGNAIPYRYEKEKKNTQDKNKDNKYKYNTRLVYI